MMCPMGNSWSDGHDFDRDEENPFTEKLLDETLAFLEENLKLSPAQCL